MFFKRKEKEQEKKIEIQQTRINELESEQKSIYTRLAKQEARTKKAVSDKQEADLALKKAKEKIGTLEETLENLRAEQQKNDEQRPIFKRAAILTNPQSHDLLSQISSIRSRNEDLLTLYLRPKESVTDLNEFDIELEEDVKYLMQRVVSPTGMVLFYDMKIKTFRRGMAQMLMTPPFPVSDSGWRLDYTFDTAQARELLELERNRVFCIVLAHAGETFIGISNRDAFIDYEIVRSSVKKKHTKGGWSQRRFERLRDEDIKHHAEKAQGVFEKLIAEYKNELTMVVASGEQNLIKEITGGDYEYRHRHQDQHQQQHPRQHQFPVLIKSIDIKAKIEKRNIDKIRVLACSARWYI